MPKNDEFNISRWIEDRIIGSGGMNDFEDHELVIWHDTERVAAAKQ